MIKKFCFFPLLGCALLLSGCLYDNPPSGPSQSIDTWLIGQWTATDKAGHKFTAVMAPASSSHYRLSLSKKGSAPQEFDGWIGRVDGFSILTLKSLNEGPSFGKYVLYHYELLSPGASCGCPFSRRSKVYSRRLRSRSPHFTGTGGNGGHGT